MKKKLLMIPGPTEVSKKVLNVLSKQVEPHYGELWRKKYLMILRKVQELIKTKNNPYILPGSGTNAMEAAICSTLNHEDHVLICYNGYWAERLIEICKSWKLKTHILKFPFNSIVDTKKLENVLKKKKNLKMVLFVHVETSTGAENPVKDIVKICNKFKVLSFVDTVAGLGGTNLNFDKMKIDILASSTQKCLESPAGLGILCISKKAKKFIKKNSKILGWYLNLNNIDRYKKNWSAWHPHGPTTAPVSIYLAFDKALEQFGAQHLVELTALMGHYAQTSFFLNAFDAELPEQVTEPLLPV